MWCPLTIIKMHQLINLNGSLYQHLPHHLLLTCGCILGIGTLTCTYIFINVFVLTVPSFECPDLTSSDFLTICSCSISVLMLLHKDLFQCFITLQVLTPTKLDIKILSVFWYFWFLISIEITAVFSIDLCSRLYLLMFSVCSFYCIVIHSHV